jgi:polyhydroxybutyrate depolymerase
MRTCLAFIVFTIICCRSYGQFETDSVLVDGHQRVFHFRQPGQDVSKSNLIFILHGSGGDGKGMMQPAANLQAIAEKENLLLVYPDGYRRFWNECRKNATSEANKVDINEESFFSAMLDYFGKKYHANSKRFFVIGLSGGGHMAYKLAITMPDQCKAISVIVANLPDTNNLDCIESKKPVAVMITNGTVDDLNPYNGGEMIMSGDSWGYVRSTNRSFHYWADMAGYKKAPKVQVMSGSDTSIRQTVVRHTYRNKRKPEVTLLQVKGGGHAFPKTFDVFLESWKFFQREIQRTK